MVLTFRQPKSSQTQMRHDMDIFISTCCLQPIKFHPYTTRIKSAVVQIDDRDVYLKYKNHFLKLFEEVGIKAWSDNKTVFEFRDGNGNPVCYGFYDNVLSIGYEVA